MLKGFGHCYVCERHTPPLPSTASPSRMNTATPRHSGQSWTGCSTISPWNTPSLFWAKRLSIIFPSAVTMAGWKIELSDDLTQTVPAYRWSQISTVSGHCLHFRSICSSKNCFAYQSSLVKSGKPPFNSCLCPKQGKNMVHSGRMHQRKQQIKPRQNRIYKRFIVAFLVVGVARLELAASCSQSRRATNCATPRNPAAQLHRRSIVYRFLRSSSIQNPQLKERKPLPMISLELTMVIKLWGSFSRRKLRSCKA